MPKIALIGPESCGKTSLAKFLSKKFNAMYVDEFARTYLENLNRPYTFDDLELIAKEQFQQYSKSAPNLQIIDTELIVMKIWSEVKFGKCCEFILENIQQQPIDLYLLCKPDIPWEFDVLREDPENREQLFELYLKEVQKLNLTYEIISGSFHEREAKALMLANKLLS